jgi:hypothetical protein
MTTPGHQTLSSQSETGIISKRIGSSSWLKGKWQDSLASTSQGKPHLSQRCTRPPHKDKRMSWVQSTPYLSGSDRCSPDPWPTMACYSSMSKSPTTGEWLGRSSDSANLSIIYVTSASELPIWRLRLKGCCKLSPRQKGGWSSPTSTSSHQTFTSLAGSSPKEGEITEGMISNGAAWTPSR